MNREWVFVLLAVLLSRASLCKRFEMSNEGKIWNKHITGLEHVNFDNFNTLSAGHYSKADSRPPVASAGFGPVLSIQRSSISVKFQQTSFQLKSVMMKPVEHVIFDQVHHNGSRTKTTSNDYNNAMELELDFVSQHAAPWDQKLSISYVLIRQPEGPISMTDVAGTLRLEDPYSTVGPPLAKRLANLSLLPRVACGNLVICSNFFLYERTETYKDMKIVFFGLQRVILPDQLWGTMRNYNNMDTAMPTYYQPVPRPMELTVRTSPSLKIKAPIKINPAKAMKVDMQLLVTHYFPLAKESLVVSPVTPIDEYPFIELAGNDSGISSIDLQFRKHDLVSIHFVTPRRHTETGVSVEVDEQQTMEVIFVHTESVHGYWKEKLKPTVYLSVRMVGSAQENHKGLEDVIQRLPRFNPVTLLPDNPAFVMYDGCSLWTDSTTGEPEHCGVRWLVFTEAVVVSRAQIDYFRDKSPSVAQNAGRVNSEPTPDPEDSILVVYSEAEYPNYPYVPTPAEVVTPTTVQP